MRILPILLLTLAALLSCVSAHMELINPPALLSKHNKFTNQNNIDYSMTSPLSTDGSNYPCKGYQRVLGTPQGQSVATWKAGSTQTWTLEGTAVHEGGSCQASISIDQGRSFKVVHSYIGACPLKNDWDFKVPGDTPQGPALFAFSWNNKIGNREFFMNCASVTISGGGGREQVPFNSRPNILTAHADSGACKIEPGFDVEYPDPGPDVTRAPNDKTILPTGNCGSSGSGDGGGGGEGRGRVSPSSQGGFPGGIGGGGLNGGVPQDPFLGPNDGSSQPGKDQGAPVSNRDCAGIPPPMMPLPIIPSANGECGQQYSCINSLFGSCCNAQGRCGKSAEDCGLGCQGAYGRCCDAQGNPNAGFWGSGTGAKEPRADEILEWIAVAVAVSAVWNML